ncbi:MAG: Na+/H+ antiporter subunit E, partial [bacterium]
YHMILANFDVMYRVLHPLMPINPGIVKVKTRLKSKSGRAALCNSITLTPGTLTVDICGEYLYIHWINVKSQDVEEAGRKIVEKFERILEKVFE